MKRRLRERPLYPRARSGYDQFARDRIRPARQRGVARAVTLETHRRNPKALAEDVAAVDRNGSGNMAADIGVMGHGQRVAKQALGGSARADVARGRPVDDQQQRVRGVQEAYVPLYTRVSAALTSGGSAAVLLMRWRP